MLKNKLLQKDNNIVRVLETENTKALIVNCIKRVVPIGRRACFKPPSSEGARGGETMPCP